MKREIKVIDLNAALDHFLKTDTLMHGRVKQAIVCKNPLLFPASKAVSEYFPTLVRSISSQQISTKAAASIYDRLRTSFQLNPQLIAQVTLQSFSLLA